MRLQHISPAGARRHLDRVLPDGQRRLQPGRVAVTIGQGGIGAVLVSQGHSARRRGAYCQLRHRRPRYGLVLHRAVDQVGVNLPRCDVQTGQIRQPAADAPPGYPVAAVLQGRIVAAADGVPTGRRLFRRCPHPHSGGIAAGIAIRRAQLARGPARAPGVPIIAAPQAFQRRRGIWPQCGGGAVGTHQAAHIGPAATLPPRA